jgi:predicted  nucleic acid-binding Zn-ribbon protein
MSEVINRIHDLQKQVFQLEEELRKIRSKYGDEVDHSDDLANLVRDMAKSLNGAYFLSSKSILEEHERRRIQDDIDENGLSVEE